MFDIDQQYIEKEQLQYKISIIMSTYLTLNEEEKLRAKKDLKQIQKELDALVRNTYEK